MKQKIIRILNSIHGGVDYASRTDLIDGHVLDSLSIIALVGELNDAFGVEINVMDLVPDNLNSVDAMAEMITRLQNEL